MDEDEFGIAEDHFNHVKHQIVFELERGHVDNNHIANLACLFDEASTDLMNAALELTRNELIEAKILANNTGYLLAENSLGKMDDFNRLKLFEFVLDDLCAEEIGLKELTQDIQAQLDEVEQLEKEVNERMTIQKKLWNEINVIKRKKGNIHSIVRECEQLENLVYANEVLKSKLEEQKEAILEEILSNRIERDEKTRLHEHWNMKKHNKETQLASLNDELYIAQRTASKRGDKDKFLVNLIAACKAELLDVANVLQSQEGPAITADVDREEIKAIESRIESILAAIDSKRESIVRRAIEST